MTLPKWEAAMLIVAYIAMLLALANCTVVIKQGSQPVAPSATNAPHPLK